MLRIKNKTRVKKKKYKKKEKEGKFVWFEICRETIALRRKKKKQ
jgi:hypothetical protein